MALKIKINQSIIITLLYLAYVLNFSVLTLWPYMYDFSLLRNLLLVVLFFVSIYKTNFTLNIPILCFVIVCFLSLIFNDIHPVFNSNLRLGFYILTITGIGVLFRNKQDSSRFINLNHIFKINTWIVILSLASYFTHIGSLGRGNFGGVFNHSNALAPIAALVCVEKVLEYYENGKNLKSLMIAFIAIFVVILSGARSSLGAMLICLTVIGIYIYRLKFIYFGTGFLVLAVTVFFVLKNYNSYLIPEEHLTNRYRSRTIFEKGFDNTRFLIWAERFDEFKENPILGSGFSAVNTKVIPKESASYDIETGSIQPGSGYLGILSMLGLSGFLIFLYIIASSAQKLYINRKVFSKKDFLIIVSILLFVLIHSIFEGYIISSGSILFLIFWLSISYILNKHVS